MRERNYEWTNSGKLVSRLPLSTEISAREVERTHRQDRSQWDDSTRKMPTAASSILRAGAHDRVAVLSWFSGESTFNPDITSSRTIILKEDIFRWIVLVPFPSTFSQEPIGAWLPQKWEDSMASRKVGLNTGEMRTQPRNWWWNKAPGQEAAGLDTNQTRERGRLRDRWD